MAFILRLIRHHIADAARQLNAAKRGGNHQQRCKARLNDLCSRESPAAARAIINEELAIILTRLPAEHAQVFRARLEGLSADTIAERIHISKRTVQVLLRDTYERWIRLFGKPDSEDH